MDWLAYSNIIDTMAETCRRKNEAYGDSFHQSVDKYGPIAALVRIEDKINRLSTLVVNGGSVDDEALEDTCLDAANYLIMLATWLVERNPETTEEIVERLR